MRSAGMDATNNAPVRAIESACKGGRFSPGEGGVTKFARQLPPV
jgi:hypothetical protein